MTFQNFYVLENVLNHGDFALIAAERFDALPKVNIANTLRLREDVMRLRPNGGYNANFTATKGQYDHHKERGFMVLSVNDEDVMRLAAKYRQESVIFGHNGYWVQRYTDGSGRPDIVLVGWHTCGPDVEDNFTEIQLTDGKFVRFALEYPK